MNARACDPPLWIARVEDVPAGAHGPVVWVASHRDPPPLPPPTAADLADAAEAKREGGGPRLVRRRMLRALLARCFGVHPAEVAVARTAAGAPVVLGLDAHVSMGGCEGWSAVAVGPGPLGVDIEASSGPDGARWVLVEAYLKALGVGLARDPDHVRIEETPEGVVLGLTATEAPAGRGWRRVVGPGVVCALAVLASPLTTTAASDGTEP